MAIMTIDDLRASSPEDVKKCMAALPILPTLEKHFRWLGDAKFQTVGQFKIGPSNRLPGIHPSTISKRGVCPMRVYMECTVPEQASSSQVEMGDQMIRDIGTIIHVMLQAHLHEIFRDQFQDEVKLLDPDLHITSSADGILTFSFARVVLEIKSIKEGGNYGYTRILASPMEDHVRQSTCYMKLADVPFAIILYFCKNNCKIKEHVLVFDQNVWNEMEREFRPVVDAVYNGGPPIEARPSSECFRCPFTYTCAHSERRKSRDEQDAECIRTIRHRPRNRS